MTHITKYDDIKEVNILSKPIYLNSDTVLKISSVTDKIAHWIINMSQENLHSAMEQLCFFKNPYIPKWFQNTKYFVPPRWPLLSARFDFIVTAQGPRVIELNTACPGAQVILPEIRKAHTYLDKTFATMTHDINSFRQTIVRAANSHSETPRIALVTSKVSPLINELNSICSQIMEMGIPCEVVFLQDLIIEDNSLKNSSGNCISTVWTKFNDDPALPLEGIIDSDPCVYSSFLNLWLTGAFEWLNCPTSFYVFEDKGWLEYLDNEKLDISPGYGIAWTKVLYDRDVLLINGEIGNLIEYCLSQKDRLVLKPRLSSRGDSIYIGKFCELNQWKQLINSSSDFGWVVQEYFSPEQPPFDTFSNIIHNGRPKGFFVRRSDTPVVSVGKGASVGLVSLSVEKQLNDECMQVFSKYSQLVPVKGFGKEFQSSLQGLRDLIQLAFTKTHLSKSTQSLRALVLRPDVIMSGDNFKILEFNVDTAVTVTHVAYLQWRNKIHTTTNNGELIEPLIKAWVELLEKLGRPLAILGSLDGHELYDPVDKWICEKIQSYTSIGIRFYSATEWLHCESIPEPFLARWISPYQIMRDDQLKHAYARISKFTQDVMPLHLFSELDSKSVLADLWLLAESDSLQEDEIKLIKAHIPWTARLNKCSKERLGQVRSFSQDFVLKKSNSHAAREVFIGKYYDKLQWNEILDKLLLSSPHEWIVQEYITNTYRMKYEGARDVHGDQIDLQAILSPFFFDGKCPGVFVRAWSEDHPEFSFAQRIFACTEEFLD